MPIKSMLSMKVCPICKTPNIPSSNYCKRCGRELHDIVDSDSEISNAYMNSDSNEADKSIYDSFNEYVDNDVVHVDVHLSDLFSNVLKHHTVEEAEDIFICGTSKTTPALKDVSSSWPKPWLYSRVFIIMILAFIMLLFGFSAFQNTKLIPGLIIIGAFAVPISIVIFFMEVNAFRNISFYNVLRIFLVGGCASLIVTLLLYSFASSTGELDLLGTFITGVVEELGKLIIVYYFIKQTKRCNFILSGMLIGATVGAGFAAFESAGYANGFADNEILQIASVDPLLNNIYVRGLLSPGGHVVWAAITGSAIMMVKGNYPLEISMLFNTKFIKIFILPIILHALWDWSALDSLGNIRYIILIVMAWIIAISLINRGLIEIKRYQ